MRHPRGGAGGGRLLTLVMVLAALALGAALLLRRSGRATWEEIGPPAGRAAAPPPAAPRSATPPPAAPPPAAPPPAAPPEKVAAAGAPASPGEGVDALLALTRQELYARARARDITGRSRMSKRQLAEAIAAHDST